MLKQLLLSVGSALLLAGSVPDAAASVTENYLEKFDNVLVTPDKTCNIKYWTRYYAYDYQRNSYSNPGEGGYDGAYLTGASSFYTDYLISPEVSGMVSFYVKAMSASPKFKVYEMTEIDGRWVVGAELLADELTAITTDSWSQMTLDAGDEGKRLGFVIQNAGIDEFGADRANLVEQSALTVTQARAAADAIPTDLAADGTITFPLNIEVTNTGTTDLKADDYKLEVYAGDYYNVGTKVGEFTTGRDLAVFETFSGEVTVTADMSGLDFTKRYNLRVMESLTSTSVKVEVASASGWYSTFEGQFVPYLPKVGVLAGGSYPLENSLQVGQVETGREGSLTIYIYNYAAKAPLSVNGVTADGGFTVEGETAFTLAAGEKKALNLHYTPETPGIHTGVLTVQTAEVGDYTLPVKAMAIPAGCNVFTLDEGTDGFILSKDWAHEALPEALARHDGDKALVQGGYSVTDIITPRLNFEEGEALYFEVASKSGSGEVEVYTSPDRVNWSAMLVKLDRFASDESNRLNLDKTAEAFGSPCCFGSYSVAMPAGDSYVKFSCYGVYLDNIAGGSPVSSAVDIYVTDANLPAAATVNNNLYATMSVRNLGDDIAAGAYTADLILDGEVLATADAPALEKGEAWIYEFDYTPHTAGSLTGYLRFKMGDYEICSPETTVVVAAESATEKFEIGKQDDYWYYHPIGVLDEDKGTYQSETVYPQAALEQLKQGDMISQIIWKGKYNGADYSSLRAKIYLQNTPDIKAPQSSAGFTDLDAMELVLDGHIALDKNMSTVGEYAQVILDKPFEYTGEGLRVVVVTDDRGTGSNYFVTDSSHGSDLCLYTNTSGSLASGPMPVIYLCTQLPVPALTGTVTDAETGEPVEGAEISLKAGQVWYDASAGTDGSYSMDIYQYSLTYQMTATAAGYRAHTASVTVGQEGTVVNIALEKIKVVVTGRLVLGGEGVDGINVSLTPADGEAMECATDADGKFMFLTTAINTAHTLSFTSDKYKGEIRQVEVGEDDIDLGDIALISGMDDAAMQAGLKATALKGAIRISSIEARDIVVCTAAGHVVKRFKAFAGEAEVENLAAGIYLVNNIKVMVK